MKKRIPRLLALCLLLCVHAIARPAEAGIIPAPANVKNTGAVMNLTAGLTVSAAAQNPETGFIAGQLTSGIKAYLPNTTSGAKPVILRIVSNSTPCETNEQYHLQIFADSVVVEAPAYAGLFYGCQSLIQLVANAAQTKTLPGFDITDQPAFAHRGMELDVCRHFFSKEVIKQYIDLMALLKMNVFHWHLTDDQGWRIEIKKYPLLTEVGAWRIEKDGTRYGGFYTQNDIKEIVAYAAQRYITIIPEIELPGHSSAAIAAYPFLSCSPGTAKTVPNTWGIKKDIYSPADSTFQFIKDVLDEVCTLFPGRYIHLGGDEAPKDAWKKSAAAQALIQKEHLKNEEQLQHFFLHKTETYLAAKGKRCIGWGEIVKGGLSDSVVVMSWLNKKAGVKAIAHGNQVIMTPRSYCYFDYPQTIRDKKNAWWMLYLTLKQVYGFNPYPKSISAAQQKLVLGGQANVWTEYITTPQQLQHQVMPRLAAMAEALWSTHKNFAGFKARLQSTALKPLAGTTN